ncbi:MAG: GNAT family N-acetyltransferase [Acidimicrobiia bacterium]|nr:GNAT family N-acetyltransferase [Acidimicrobiia bacterium]NNF63653.1 GNAT family N-acetyltransferase [Acidimicrobiia bacterium]
MIEIRPVLESEFEDMRAFVNRGFGGDIRPDDAEGLAGSRAVFELDRTYCAFEDGTLVGTAADFALEVAVPGRVVPMAGTTIVVVLPTHRRRGLLTQMMRAHVDETHDRGEPLAGLWASETVIYGRFGFGCATDRLDFSFDARRLGPWVDRELDAVRMVDKETADPLVRSFFAEWFPTRPGALVRTDAWWTHRILRDPEQWRGGASALRFALAERDGEVVGYCSYRQTEKFENWEAEGSIDVVDLFSMDARADASLWRFLARIDLFPNVKSWNMPLDVNLAWQVGNRRAIRRSISDGLWLRLIDVAAAFASRSAAAVGGVNVEVIDAFCPWNRGVYRIVGDDGQATATKTTQLPDLTMDVSTLGAMFLGGRDAVALMDAGLVEGDRRAAATLSAILAADTVPWCPDVF